MSSTPRTFRLIFLGAGFSKPAGLPLGSELFVEIRRITRSRYGKDNYLERDLGRYLEYLTICEGKSETTESVNYEEFLGFLDLEHYLGLKGKDTWSSEGNESQFIVRRAISEILYERTPNDVPDLYRRFARQLNPSDWIFTFNYDTLLEAALEVENIQYRLFPNRFSKIGSGVNTIDSSVDEVVV